MENKQDLMVGNLMQDAKGRICRVEQVSVNEEDCKIYAIDGPTTTYPIKPIVLTNEILFLSAEQISEFAFLCDRFKLVWRSDYSFWYVTDKETDCYLTKIEFVHELQKFVFVMNGNHLEIKL